MHFTDARLQIIVACMVDPLDTSTLEAARKNAGLSRADLAKLSGIHETTIMRIETGRVDPRVDGTWAKLIRAVLASGEVV